jgi:cytochrome c biogenesis protein CcdA
MEEWIRHTLSAQHLGLAVLPAAFLFGVLASVSSCCTLPVLGAVAGYAGSLAPGTARRDRWLVALSFLIGTVLSLAALGAVTGFVGDVAGYALGKYWRIAAGLVAVVFGLVSLNLLKLKTPKLDLTSRSTKRSVAGALVYGLALGGGTTACAFGCNPLIPVAMGGAVLQGKTMLGAALLGVFALGYALPLAAGVVGIGFGVGSLGRIAQRVMPVARVVGGLLLLAVGFYLLKGA